MNKKKNNMVTLNKNKSITFFRIQMKNKFNKHTQKLFV